MGTMTFGVEGKEGARVHNIDDVRAILDTFQEHGHTEIDTARGYTSGTSEELLGSVEWKKRGLIAATKIYPSDSIKHTAKDIRATLDKSLAALQTDKVDIYYLHAPDRSTPLEVSLKAIDDLHQEGKFDRFGISNYPSWEVGEIVALCRINNWVQPTVYQGLYNAIHRSVEPELFPALRKYGISFYEYNPLGGGFFTGRYKTQDTQPEPGSRFDVSKGVGSAKAYRNRYWNDKYFSALEIVEEAAKKHNLTIGEVALRWMSHHSALKREHGDAIIMGASSLAHVHENLLDLEKGPLPEEVVDALDTAWRVVDSRDIIYWR